MSVIHRWQRLIERWTSLPLRTKNLVLAGIPLLAIGVSSTFAYLGNRERARAETDVVRHFDVVTDLEELLTLVVNAETGVRGYLLTRRPEFLQPYQTTARRWPDKLADLRAEVAQEPGREPRLEKQQRVARITALVAAQMRYLQAVQKVPAAESTNDLYQQLASSKRGMDELRAQLRLMRVAEKSLLSQRLAEIKSVRQRDYWAIGLTLLLSLGGRFLALHLFNVGVVRRIQHVQENVRSLGEDHELEFEPSAKSDALGELEREVASAHQRLRSPGGHGPVDTGA